MGIRSRREWCSHSINKVKRELVGISGQVVQPKGEAELLVNNDGESKDDSSRRQAAIHSGSRVGAKALAATIEL